MTTVYRLVIFDWVLDLENKNSFPKDNSGNLNLGSGIRLTVIPRVDNCIIPIVANVLTLEGHILK